MSIGWNQNTNNYTSEIDNLFFGDDQIFIYNAEYNGSRECIDDPEVCIWANQIYNYNQVECEENGGTWSGYLDYFGCFFGYLG